MDWREWHRDYDDPRSALSRRLAIVQREISAALELLPVGDWHVISICAGDGRDLLGVLAGHPRAHDATGLLVEIDEHLVAAGRAAYTGAGLTAIEVRTGDAGDPSHYAGRKADLLLVCGVFGNLADDAVPALTQRLPGLCASGCTLVWTRHQQPPDLTISIRADLTRAGFHELGFYPVGDSWGAVGVARYQGPTVDFNSRQRMFEFRADRAQTWRAARS